MRTPLPTRIAAVLVAIAIPSCAQIIGLDQYHDGICVPGSKTREGCPYGGPAGTRDVGICSAGEKVCNEDGSAWGDCSDPILPKDEDCSTPLDENCDGEVNEKGAGCCTKGETFSCYSGAEGTEGVGACKAGTQTCGADGTTIGGCTGEAKPTQELCSDTIDNDCDHRECVEWALAFGDATIQLVEASAQAPDGSVYLAGEFDGAIVLGSQTLISQGGGDAFLIKLDASGVPLWGKSFGDALFQEFTAITTDTAGNVTVAGRSGSASDLGGGPLAAGVFVAQFAADGKFTWNKWLSPMFGSGTDASVVSLAATAQGDVVAGGHFGGTLDLGDGPVVSKGGDALLMRLNGKTGSGKLSDGGWLKTFGDAADQYVVRVAVTPQDEILAVGYFKGQIDLGSGPLTASSGYDGFVAKFDGLGVKKAYHHLVGPGDQQILDMVIDATGGPIITGTSDQDFNVAQASITAGGFVLRYGPDLSLAWGKSFGTGLAAVATDAKSNVAVTGLFQGSVDFGDGPLTAPTGVFAMFLAKLDGTGAPLWKRAFTTTTTSLPDFIGFGGQPHFTQSGELLLTGGLTGTVDFGGLPLSSAGGMDILVAKFGL